MRMASLTSMMPGQWPGEFRFGFEEHVHVQAPVSPIGAENQRDRGLLPYPLTAEEASQVPSSSSAATEFARSQPVTPCPTLPSVPDELFFDWPLRSQPPMQNDKGDSSSTSYLIFEPVVEEEVNIERTDWRRYDPPKELLQAQDGTSQILGNLLAASIERIQARHMEEVEERAAASRIERPLARAGRASVKPRRKVSSFDLSIYDNTKVSSGINARSFRYNSPHTTLKIDCHQRIN